MKERRFDYRITEANTKTSSSTKPSVLSATNQGLPTNIATPSIYDVTAFKLVPRETINMFRRHPGDAFG